MLLSLQNLKQLVIDMNSGRWDSLLGNLRFPYFRFLQAITFPILNLVAGGGIGSVHVAYL